MTGDPIPAIIDQLAACAGQLARLDAREAGHHATASARLAELTGLISGLAGTLHDDAAALARLDALDRQVADLAALLAAGEAGPCRYRPEPAPAWWKLAAAERQEPLARLRAWVDQVYRPGYGHLAAALGPCWPAHDLCLYGLDILAGLWSALYQQPRRTPGLLSAQAEYQARILPALAAQLAAETSGCGHARPADPVPAYLRSRP